MLVGTNDCERGGSVGNLSGRYDEESKRICDANLLQFCSMSNSWQLSYNDFGTIFNCEAKKRFLWWHFQQIFSRCLPSPSLPVLRWAGSAAAHSSRAGEQSSDRGRPVDLHRARSCLSESWAGKLLDFHIYSDISNVPYFARQAPRFQYNFRYFNYPIFCFR